MAMNRREFGKLVATAVVAPVLPVALAVKGTNVSGCEDQRHQSDLSIVSFDWPDGTRVWYQVGPGWRHRVGGPAIEWPDGAKEWFCEGRRHRIDGPAIEWPDGSKQWYIDGQQVSEPVG